jgi:type II secretory pathway pseudopilin PulG
MCRQAAQLPLGSRTCIRAGQRGFSLVEVTIALGIAVFAILSVVGLLSVGILSNRISIEETRASTLLTILEADLRNTLPGTGLSGLYGLPMPYATNAGGEVVRNPALMAGTLGSTGVDGSGQPVPLSASPPSAFQASVVYVRIPPTGSLLPTEARLIVNWPGTNSTNVEALGRTTGMVEALVSFPAP